MISFKPFKSTYLFLFLLLNLQLISYAQSSKLKVETASARTGLYVNLLKGKNIAVVANQTSVIFKEIYKKKINFSLKIFIIQRYLFIVVITRKINTLVHLKNLFNGCRNREKIFS